MPMPTENGSGGCGSGVAHNIHPEPKNDDPADFARQLARHAGFDVLSQHRSSSHVTPPPVYMTPPPRYSRLEQPRLTLVIPDHVVRDDIQTTTLDRASLPQPIVLESVDSSPVTLSKRRSGELSISNRIRTKLRKKSIGIKDRIRRSDTNFPSLNVAGSPCESSSSTSMHELDSAETSVAWHQDLSDIHELDGLPVHNTSIELGAELPRWLSCVPSGDRANDPRCSSSSIVPTPRRGLSMPLRRSNQEHMLNAQDLSGRLQSLHSQQGPTQVEELVSPCVTLQPLRDTTCRSPRLSRSNAVTESIAPGLDSSSSPVSPAALDPPATPTLEGRLDRLPRLITPGVLHSSFRERRAVGDHDTGKELVTSLVQLSGRLDRPVNLPQWRQSTTTRSVNAPEVQPRSTWTFQQQRSSIPDQTSMATTNVALNFKAQGTVVESAREAVSNALTFAGGVCNARYNTASTIPHGHARVRWRCDCGEDLFDDFVEHRLGAASELEARLNKVDTNSASSPWSSHPTSAVSSVFSPVDRSSPLSPISEWSSPGSANSYNHASRISGCHEPVSAERLTIAQSFVDPLWLYVCLKDGNKAIRLRHLDVNKSKVTSDGDLALTISRMYAQSRKGWFDTFRLRKLASVRMVQFELHRNKVVDVSSSTWGPNLQNPESHCYNFTSNGLNPPVGPNYLRHLFQHPEDYDDEYIAYSAVPKSYGRHGIGIALGLELIEEISMHNFSIAALILLFIALLIFASTWAYTSHMESALSASASAFVISSSLLVWAQVR